MNPAHSGIITMDLIKIFTWFLITKATILVGLWLILGVFHFYAGDPGIHLLGAM